MQQQAALMAAANSYVSPLTAAALTQMPHSTQAAPCPIAATSPTLPPTSGGFFIYFFNFLLPVCFVILNHTSTKHTPTSGVFYAIIILCFIFKLRFIKILTFYFQCDWILLFE